VSRIDLLLYVVHAAFWATFGIASHRADRMAADDPPPVGPAASGSTTKADQPQVATRSRLLIVMHIAAFAVLYFGIAQVVLPATVPAWFPGQRVVGLVIIAGGAAIMAWARLYFRSWRFRAKLDAGHELATGGPFALVRHPIYLGLDLLAVGTGVWAPTVIVWIGAVLVIIGCDLRARAEEKLLSAAFGTAYDDYRAHTRRFVPGLY
jgi:protein-S-isoprenylcysteine O-methyltransferase Ste14